jgi:hypothetical protein
MVISNHVGSLQTLTCVQEQLQQYQPSWPFFSEPPITLYRGWIIPGEAMPENGYIALGLWVGFSLIGGCSLMAVLFYSGRHGYDDPPLS